MMFSSERLAARVVGRSFGQPASAIWLELNTTREIRENRRLVAREEIGADHAGSQAGLCTRRKAGVVGMVADP
jgi:hypothetical protein